MLANENDFKFFIEDDKSFPDYMKEMQKDGIWGGNLEIQALAMRFSVNFYIHIYNHPMYIVRNFDNPMKNVHLSYHDGVSIY
jgi:OTU domain-containing protein 3